MAVTFAFLAFVLIAVEWEAASGRLSRIVGGDPHSVDDARDQSWVAVTAALHLCRCTYRLVLRYC